MSAFLLGIGFRADMGTCARKLVLLKLIDACDDDGSRIFPAIATIARAAQCSARQVQRELQAFRDVGLISLVKEGGKGPRSTNEYRLDLDMLQRLGRDGWSAVTGAGAKADDAPNKGDTVSPLERQEKGDTGDTVRVTPATDKGDIACHPTPYYPSNDPSSASERVSAGGEGANRKRVETAFDRAWREWPVGAAGSRDGALRAWMALTEADREAAKAGIGRWIAAAKAVGRKFLPAFSTYLGDRAWEGLPSEASEPAAPAVVKPFGKAWNGVRIADLLGGHGPLPPPRGFVATLIEQGGEAGERERLRHQAAYGWPKVRRMDEQAENRRGWTLTRAEEAIAALAVDFEAVQAGSALWSQWRAEFERRGWPWLTDAGNHKWFFFPAGGPDGLAAFAEHLGQKAATDAGRHEHAA